MASQTPNIGLQLYEDKDPANLTDQYNASMETLDGMIPGISNNSGQAIARLNALGITNPEAAAESKTSWDGAVDLSKTNEENIASIDANLNALGVNTVPEANELKNSINGKLDKLSVPRSTINFKLYPHCVVIGDSIASALNVSDSERWTNWLCRYYGMTEHNYAVSGTGFINAKTPNFAAQLQNAIDDDSYDKNQVGLVIVSGGINDDPNDNSEIQAVSDLFNSIRSTYPNAVTMCVPCLCGPLYNDDLPSKRTATLIRIINGCDNPNVDIVYGSAIYWLQGGDSWMQRDLLHPNEIGHRIIAQNVIKRLEGSGDYNIYPSPISYRITPDEIDVEGIQTVNGYMFITKITPYSFMLGGLMNMKIAEGCPLIGKTGFDFNIPLPAWFKGRISPSTFRVHAFNRMSDNGESVTSRDNAIIMGQVDKMFVTQSHPTALVANDKCELYIPPIMIPTIGYVQ